MKNVALEWKELGDSGLSLQMGTSRLSRVKTVLKLS